VAYSRRARRRGATLAESQKFKNLKAKDRPRVEVSATSNAEQQRAFLAHILLVQGRMRWQTSLIDRAFRFGAEALRLAPKIAQHGPEYGHVSKQLYRCATSVGANLEEGQVAMSRRDMGLKHAIALREARESVYWLRMLMNADIMTRELEPMRREGTEIVAMLTVSVKKLRQERPEG